MVDVAAASVPVDAGANTGSSQGGVNAPLASRDPQIARFIDRELERQQCHLELIASENFASRAVMELSLIHISEPTRLLRRSRMPSSA